MNKTNIKRILIFIGAITLIALSTLSCSIPKSNSDYLNSKLSSLESKLSLIQAANAGLESQHKSEIEALESIIKDLRDDLSSFPDASETRPTVENEYFGFKYLESDGKIIISSYSGTSTDLIIPASIGGMPVVSIADNAFQNTDLSSVSIPETVESIGWFAFESCAALKMVIVSKNVNEIGFNAFANCKDLVIYAPESSYAYQYAKSYGLAVSAE